MRMSLFLLLACALVAFAQDDSGAGRLTLDVRLDWEDVRSPTLSPDGSQIAFSRSWTDKINDRMKSEVWIMDADGSRPRFLLEGSSPRWAPDGKRIAYTHEGKPKGSQIWVMWIETKEATQITHLTEAPSGLRWSPDGKRIAFNMQVPESDGFSIKLPERPKGAKWAPTPRVVSRLTYRRDRRGYVPSGWRHIFVVDSEGGTPRQVTKGDHDHGAPRWSPDGTRLYFSGLRAEDADWQVRESDVYAVDVKSGDVTQLTHRKGPDSGPVPSPDGKYVAYTGHDMTTDTYNVAKIYVMDADGANVRCLTPDLDRQPRGLMWSKDSAHVYFSVRANGEGQAWRVGLREVPRVLTKGRHRFTISDVAGDGRLLGTRSAPKEPTDIWMRATDGAMTRLTRVNDDVLEGRTLGDVVEVKAKSIDGLEVEGWLVRPPGFDPKKKYPLILQIHGGPHGMYGVDFSFERQNHAAEGYLVLYTNPRGSAGYGKQFGNAINNAYPGRDYDDLMACVDAVIDQGIVDEENMFVYGGSGGGVLTCWIVGHTDRFRAAVSMFPVTNWISFVGTTDGPYWYTNFKKLPWEDITEHWNRSPLKYVGRVTTPTMLITGELDLRTPMAQTEEFYQALRLRKVDSVMVRVPNEYHGAAGRHVSNQLRRILYVRGWFEKYGTHAKKDDENREP